MSSPVWKQRRWKRNQIMNRRPRVLSLRKEGIRWPPRVGDWVCDCRFRHARVVSIDVIYGDVMLDHGMGCDLDQCLGPADHPDTNAAHALIAAELQTPWDEEEEEARAVS